MVALLRLPSARAGYAQQMKPAAAVQVVRRLAAVERCARSQRCPPFRNLVAAEERIVADRSGRNSR